MIRLVNEAVAMHEVGVVSLVWSSGRASDWRLVFPGEVPFVGARRLECIGFVIVCLPRPPRPASSSRPSNLVSPFSCFLFSGTWPKQVFLSSPLGPTAHTVGSWQTRQTRQTLRCQSLVPVRVPVTASSTLKPRRLPCAKCACHSCLVQNTSRHLLQVNIAFQIPRQWRGLRFCDLPRFHFCS